jgi:hypothetical protein
LTVEDAVLGLYCFESRSVASPAAFLEELEG